MPRDRRNRNLTHNRRRNPRLGRNNTRIRRNIFGTDSREHFNEQRRWRRESGGQGLERIHGFLRDCEQHLALCVEQRSRLNRMVDHIYEQRISRSRRQSYVRLEPNDRPDPVDDLTVEDQSTAVDDQETNPLQSHVELPALLSSVRFLAEFRGEQPEHTLYELMRRREALDASGSVLDRVGPPLEPPPLPVTSVSHAQDNQDDDENDNDAIMDEYVRMILNADTNGEQQASENNSSEAPPEDSSNTDESRSQDASQE